MLPIRFALFLLFAPVAWAQGFVQVAVFGVLGSGPGEFDTPFDVVVGGGELYVADSNNNRVQVFGLDLVFRRSFGGTGDLPGQFRRDRGIGAARVGSLRIYVTDAKNDRVHELLPDGDPIAVWGSIGQGEEQFFRPRGVDVAVDGSIAITDTDNHRMKVYRADRSLRAVFGARGSHAGQFVAPFDCAVSEAGELFVVDAFNARVQVFDLDGRFLRSFGTYGPEQGQFVVPQAIAIAPDGRVFVAERADSVHEVERIQIFSAAGDWEGSFGVPGNGAGQLRWVAGLAFDDEGRLYAAEAGNQRVSVWADPATIAARRSSVSELKSIFGSGTGGG